MEFTSIYYHQCSKGYSTALSSCEIIVQKLLKFSPGKNFQPYNNYTNFLLPINMIAWLLSFHCITIIIIENTCTLF